MTLEISYIIKWLVEQFGNELNDFKQIVQAQQVQFFWQTSIFSELFGTIQYVYNQMGAWLP